MAKITESREYECWAGMKQRCYDSNRVGWKNYGGRGIEVCDRWRNSFENFLADMGERPEGHSLDRIDNDGNYEPSNCRWATKLEQQNNQRRTCKITFRGKTLGRGEWARLFGIDHSLVTSRLRIGWSVEKALTTPKKVWVD